MKNCGTSSSKLDRKTIERNRRMQMKSLSFKLASLIPHNFNPTKEISTQKDQFVYAASYIKELKERVESLKERKKKVMESTEINNDIRDTMTMPVLQLRDTDYGLEITLITGLNNKFIFSEVIRILPEHGAEIVSANYSTVGEKVFHTIHSQATSSRIGVDTTSLSQRLKEYIFSSSWVDSEYVRCNP